MRDLIDIFKDPSVLEVQLKITMINCFGKEENASDVNGVFRDALSEFWRCFEESCTVGESGRIPVIRHDFQAPEWEAIGRILVKGFCQLNFFPIKLNRAFLIATLFGEQALMQHDLLDSFLAYLSKDEQTLVSSVLNGNLDDDQADEWLDFLQRFGCKRVPRLENRRDILLEIAHKELIQAGQYIIDCWRKPLCQLKTAIPNITDLQIVYNRAVPTPKKVIDLLRATPAASNQIEALSYLKRYIRGLDDEKLGKVLRFFTGASVICVDKIRVSFTHLEGSQRRPIAHTCGPCLELPATYEKYPEFRCEMNNIIDSGFLDMDFV